MPFEPGSRIGPYVIVARLGAGGMGEVFRARDERLGRDVAIKAVRPEVAADRARLARFLAEARTVAALNHPSILTLHDFGEHEGSPYLVTELIEGRTLREVIAAGGVDVDTALSLAVQIAQGLAKAHAAGIVHRDVKPENVMLTRDGHAKILDFGLAKLRDPSGPGDLTLDANLTATGMIVGTPAYMSPEQLRGRPADARSDVFALGLVIYELVAGANPFRKDSAVETMNAILNEEAPPLAGKSGIPPLLSDIVSRATAKDPARRFADGRELADTLEALRKGSSAISLAAPRPVRRRLGWIAAAAAVAAGVTLAWDLSRRQPASELPSHPGHPPLAAAAMPAVPRIPTPEGKMGIAILPILDEAGDEDLARAGIGRILADAFVQMLVDFPGFYVIDRFRLESIAMRLGRTMEDAAEDRALARQIGEQADASAVLSGRLSRLGNVYILNATLTQIPSDIVMHSFQAQASNAASLVAELTGRVAEELRHKYAIGSEVRDVGTVATRDQVALTHYVRGNDLINEGNWEAAIPELEEAIRLDPEMALGWSALSCAFSFAGREAEARACFHQATRFAERLNAQQRKWVELDGLWVNTQNGDLYLQAMDAYRREYPDDHRSALYTGLAWQWLKGECDSALAWYEQAFHESPGWYPVTKARVDCLVTLGQVDEARRILREYLALPFVHGYGREQATLRLQELEKQGA